MSEQPDRTTPPTITRRGVLAIGASGLLVAGLEAATPNLALAAPADAPTFELDFTRAADMVHLHFAFHNLDLSKATTPPQLVRKDATKPAYIVVGFPSQHVMEEPVYETNPRPAPGKLKSQAVLDSRIAFRIPQTVKSLPYTEEGLFGWWQWVMNVVPAALPPDAKPRPVPATNVRPGELETDLLLVDWIHLSPDRSSTWLHAAEPITRDGRTELWHTRLANRDEDGKPTDREGPTSLRAIYAETPEAGTKFTVFESRHPKALVEHTSNYNLAYVKHASTDLVLLSTAGSSLELKGEWAHPAPLERWDHRSWIGRDNFVRVINRGYLYPFGHRAVLIRVNERRVENGVAYLFQRTFIQVRQPTRTFPDLEGPIVQPNQGREFPFTSIRLTTTETPTLPPDGEKKRINGDPTAQSFWVTDAAGNNLPFPVVATTIDGRTVEFTSFLAFVYLEESANDEKLKKLVESFQSFETIGDPYKLDPRRQVDLGGQELTFAPQLTPEEDATFPVTAFYLGADRIDGATQSDFEQENVPNFWPTILAAEVNLPAVNALSGSNQLAVIGYDPAYRDGGRSVDDDKVGLYARVQYSISAIGKLRAYLDGTSTTPPSFEVTTSFDRSDKTGGIAAPNLTIGGLSIQSGPLSGEVDSITKLQAEGTVNPLDFFPKTSKSIFLGGISLREILFLNDTPDGLPVITRNETADALATILDWKPRLRDNCESVFSPYGVDGEPGTLELHVETRTARGTGETTYSVKGEARDFSVYLAARKGIASCVKVVFEQFLYESRSGGSPTTKVRVAEVEFINTLEFLNEFRKFLGFDEESGLTITAHPLKLNIGYEIGLPDAPLGNIRLSNLALSAELEIPYTSDSVTVTFAFASREDPFTATYNLLGGGGFFEIELASDRVDRIEFAIQAGAFIPLDVPGLKEVVSGHVSAALGIHLRFTNGDEEDDEQVVLTGYVRVSGRVSFLGLITISAEFYLALQYVNDNGTPSAYGEVKIRISIDILFFSRTLEYHVRKKIAGSGGDANLAAAATHEFADLMSQSEWNSYCDSFAG